MVWSLAGFAIALLVGAIAWRRSRSPGGFYDREVYGLDCAAHRRYAIVSFVFAAYFAAVYARRLDFAGIAGLALYALIALFYGTSFLRGASDE
jgi:hypothetical protein